MLAARNQHHLSRMSYTVTIHARRACQPSLRAIYAPRLNRGDRGDCGDRGAMPKHGRFQDESSPL